MNEIQCKWTQRNVNISRAITKNVFFTAIEAVTVLSVFNRSLWEHHNKFIVMCFCQLYGDTLRNACKQVQLDIAYTLLHLRFDYSCCIISALADLVKFRKIYIPHSVVHLYRRFLLALLSKFLYHSSNSNQKYRRFVITQCIQIHDFSPHWTAYMILCS